jgi:hypothetical protein
MNGRKLKNSDRCCALMPLTLIYQSSIQPRGRPSVARRRLFNGRRSPWQRVLGRRPALSANGRVKLVNKSHENASNVATCWTSLAFIARNLMMFAIRRTPSSRQCGRPKFTHTHARTVWRKYLTSVRLSKSTTFGIRLTFDYDWGQRRRMLAPQHRDIAATRLRQ